MRGYAVNAELALKRLRKSKFAVDKMGRNLQKKLDRRYARGKGAKVTILRRIDWETAEFECEKHGVWKDELRRIRDNMSFTCGSCAKESQAAVALERSAKRFKVLWEKRRNSSLTLLEPKYLGSYVKHRAFCEEHQTECYIVPNGDRYLSSFLCKQCTLLYKYAKYGEGITSPAQIPGHKERLQATFRRNWGADHYMKTAEGFQSSLCSKFRRKEFKHNRLSEVSNGESLVCQGEEPSVLKFLLDNDPEIVAMSTDASDFPLLTFLDKRGRKHRYFPDAVIRRLDGTTRIVEVKVDYTLAGNGNILEGNLRKFAAASNFCKKKAKVSFHLFVVGKDVLHYKDPVNNADFKARYCKSDPAFGTASSDVRLSYDLVK